MTPKETNLLKTWYNSLEGIMPSFDSLTEEGRQAYSRTIGFSMFKVDHEKNELKKSVKRQIWN